MNQACPVYVSTIDPAGASNVRNSGPVRQPANSTIVSPLDGRLAGLEIPGQ